MTIGRTRRSLLAVFALVLALPIVPGGYPARAADAEAPIELMAETYPLTFPIVGAAYYTDTFGACRSGCSRTHEGIDIMVYGWKGVPIVAAHDGVITRTTESSGRPCCAIWGLDAGDGWESWYIHMNNDTPGTDDGQGWGFAPGIGVGSRVRAGDLIGWVGDSGNAESVTPHLHFELHRDGVPVNPYESLLAATTIDLPRHAGANRFTTAVDISHEAYPGGASIAYIATAYNFPDALAGGTGATRTNGPILLTEIDTLPAVTRDELRRLGPTRVMILGGEAAVGVAVEEQLRALGYEVDRLAGADRYDTAAMISKTHFDPGVSYAFVTGGLDFAAAVAGAPVAAIRGAPMLLTRPDSLPQYTRDELARLRPDVIVVLGDAEVVGSTVEAALVPLAASGRVLRVAGSGRSGTATSISQWAFPAGADRAYLATSGTFVDALAGVAVAAHANAPILLVGETLEPGAAAELRRLGVRDVVALGGPAAVTMRVAADVWNLTSGNTMPLWK
jgi:putative cell wall-binding protein